MPRKTRQARAWTPAQRPVCATAALILALAAPGMARAAETTVLGVPIQSKFVEEYRLADDSVIQQALEYDENRARIELGFSGSGRFAEAYSTFNETTQISTYWVSIDDYPGIPGSPPGSFFDNGMSTATVAQWWQMRKDASDATLTLHVTGGRLRLQDYAGDTTQVAEVGLTWSVYTPSVNVSSGDYNALLGGHGGLIGSGSETFDFDSRGFLLNPDSYTENTAYAGSLNVVEAILDIPAQDIEIDISSIIPFNEFTTSDGEFTLFIGMYSNALAVDPERGGTAQAFLRDPVSMGQADPLLGGNGLSFTGITVLAPAPVPEPANWALFLAGCGLLGWIAQHRRSQANGLFLGNTMRANG
jgi:hypothetical protein